MKALALYLATAIVTGLLAFYLAMEMIWGAPLNPLHYVSFLGSVLLFIASLTAPFSPRVGAKIAVAGSIATWCLYGPAIVSSILMPFTTWQSIKFDLKFREYVPVVGLLAGPILLVAATVYAIAVLKRPLQSE
jgi:hypothetical protein